MKPVHSRAKPRERSLARRVTAALRAWVALTAFVSPTAANDATFGGAGADLVPLEEARVRMVSEDILIEYRRQWYVTARYVFENSSSRAVRLQVGFPEYRCQNEGEDCANVPFRGLRTEVNGVEVSHRVGTVAEGHPWKPHLGPVWLYDVTFAPATQTRILHSYSLESGRDVESNRFTTYVTRTGAAWAGDIGQARFTFRLPPEAHSIVVPEGIPLRQLRTVDADGPEPYVEVICEAEHWEPGGDLFLSFNASARTAMARLGNDALARSGIPADERCRYDLPEENQTPAQRQMCRNDDYAVAGYPFAKQQLQRFYYGGAHDWHQEAVAYDASASWFVRGLRVYPKRRRWTGAAPPPAVTGSPTAVTAAAPTPTDDRSGPPMPIERRELADAPLAAPVVAPPSEAPAPSSVQRRPGACGCRLASSSVPAPSVLLVLLLAAVSFTRVRRSSPPCTPRTS